MVVAARLDDAHTSTPGPFHSVAQALKFDNDTVPMVTLDLNAPVLNRSTGAQSLLQRRGQFGKPDSIQWQVGDDRYPLATPAFRLSAYPNHGGFAWGRWLGRTRACGL